MQNKPRLSSLSLGLLAASFLMTSGVTFAAANYKNESYKGEVAAPMAAPCKILKDGFYAGIQGGYDSYRTRVSSDAVLANTLGTIAYTQTGNPQISSNGFEGGLFAGYGQYIENIYYLGGEIFVNDSGASSSFNETSTSNVVAPTARNYSAKLSVSTSYGISFLPGVKLNDSSLLYLRLGYNRVDLKGQEWYSIGGTNGRSAYASNSNWEGGFQFGLGMESVFYDNFSVRGEYNHTSFTSFNTSLNGNSNTSFNPSDNQVTLGLIYHFA